MSYVREMTPLQRAKWLLEQSGVREAIRPHGRTGDIFIQRTATEKPYYRIAQMANVGSAERNLTVAYTSGELVAYLEGVRHVVNTREMAS